MGVDDSDDFAGLFLERDAATPVDVHIGFPEPAGSEVQQLASYQVDSLSHLGESLQAEGLSRLWEPGTVRGVVLRLPDHDRTYRLRFIGGGDTAALVFPDNSVLDLGPGPESFWDPLPPRDGGAALLEPIEDDEYGAVERLLGLLWKAAAAEALTPAQEAQVRAIAEMISSEHRSTTPGTSRRWHLVGAVRSGLLFLTVELPTSIVMWPQAAQVLRDVRWTDLADRLPGG